MQVDFSGRDVASVVDLLVTWIGAAALWRYVEVLGERQARGILESRTQFLFGTISVLLFVRGFAWLSPGHAWLDFLVFAPVSLLPIAMTLFVEALLRRHAPVWIKRIATAATVAGFTANALRGFLPSGASVVVDATLLVGLLVTMLALAWLLARRDRSSLSSSENAIVRVCAVLAVIGLPLVVTDFRTTFGIPPVRLGTLGALLFCYSLVRAPDASVRLRDWTRDVSRLLAKAVIACMVLAIALGTDNTALILPLSALLVAMLFAVTIFDRLRDTRAATARGDLLRWLGRATPRGDIELVAELSALPLTADASVLADGDLDAYDREALVRTFAPHRVVYGLPELRWLRDNDARAARGADELTDILERRGATHVALIDASAPRLLVATLPELGQGTETEAALTAIARRAERAFQ